MTDTTTDTAPAQGDPMPDTSTRPTPRHLRDLIDEHLDHYLRVGAHNLHAVATDHDEAQAAIDDMARTIRDRVLVSADVAKTSSGRIRPGTLRVRVYLRGDETQHNSDLGVELFSVRARDLLQHDGTPVDAKADARTLLLQLGYGVPDDTSTLDSDGDHGQQQ